MWYVRHPMLVVIAAALAAAHPLAAQEGEQPQGLAALQSKNALSPEELDRIKAWVNERVEAIARGGASGSVVQELREGCTGTDVFKEAYVSAAVEAIRPVYARAPLTAAAQLITVLHTFDDRRVYEVLIEALADPRPAVRTAAAIGLRVLRPGLAQGGGEAAGRAMAALRDAGKKETSEVALKRMYEAMNYAAINAAPNPKANAQAILDVLNERAQQYAGKKVDAWAADVVGLQAMQGLWRQLNDEERVRLLKATGQMLRAAVERYVGELHKIDDESASAVEIEERNDTELLVETAEQLLVAILNPQDGRPDITAKMKGGRNTVFDMKVEMNEWAKQLLQATGEDFRTGPSQEQPEEAP